MKRVKLGVIEFNTPKNKELIKDFFMVTEDCRKAACIVDIWLMDIATILERHGYKMVIYKESVEN